MAGEKTEKATPKKKDDARKKGQVARSVDLNGAVILLAGLAALAAAGPMMVQRSADEMRRVFAQVASPQVVDHGSIGQLLADAGLATLLAVAPVAFACAVAAVGVSVAQVGFKPSAEAAKPDPKRLNPISGFKNIYGPNAAVEGVKNVSKVAIVGAITFAFVAPQLTELGAMVGMSPVELGAALSDSVLAISFRAAAAYFLIGAADYAWQRHRHEKQLRMDHQEIKEEMKGQALPAEVKAQQRRRAMEAARARMMSAVPEADVVVTNPTHFAVALKYDGTSPAPTVVAKGQDLVALKIRELAEQAGVPIIEDVPLARGLHASVEVDQQIPEEFFAAVAQVLAFVYRIRKRSS